MEFDEDYLPHLLEFVFPRTKKGNSHFVLEIPEGADIPEMKPLAEFNKKINLISVALKDIHNVDLMFFFNMMPLTRRNIFTLISSHCFKVCDNSDNIFFAFMYICSYVNFVVNFCEECGLEQFSDLNRMCTQEVFKYRLEEDFESQGGWAEFEKFSLSNNLPEIIHFLGACYTDYWKLFTPLTIDGKKYGYGIHNNTTFSSAKSVFTLIERLIIISYSKEFEADPQYLVEVLSSFKHVRSNLEQSNANRTMAGDLNEVRGRIVNISHIHVTVKSTKKSKKKRRRR